MLILFWVVIVFLAKAVCEALYWRFQERWEFKNRDYSSSATYRNAKLLLYDFVKKKFNFFKGFLLT